MHGFISCKTLPQGDIAKYFTTIYAFEDHNTHILLEDILEDSSMSRNWYKMLKIFFRNHTGMDVGNTRQNVNIALV